MSNLAKFTVILLAAGMSARMGADNKLLLPVDEKPLVRRSAMLYTGLGMQVTIVLGHEADKVKAALSGLDVTFVFNADYACGQHSSVRVGLDAINTSKGEAILIALSDQPLLTADDITAYCGAFLAGPHGKITVPFWGEARGNPVIFPRSLIDQFRADRDASTCRKFIDTNPQLVRRYIAPNNHFTYDIDSQDDFKRLSF